MKTNKVILLPYIKNAIDNKYQLGEITILEETNIDDKGNQFEMKVNIKKGKGQTLLVCRFDVKEDLFPYFQNKEGYKKNCDYIVFAESAAKLYVFLVELKDSQESPQRQLYVSKTFAEFIISRIKVVEDNMPDKEIIYKMIGIKKKARKKSTKGFEDDYKFEDDYLLLPNPKCMDLDKIIDHI